MRDIDFDFDIKTNDKKIRILIDKKDFLNTETVKVFLEDENNYWDLNPLRHIPHVALEEIFMHDDHPKMIDPLKLLSLLVNSPSYRPKEAIRYLEKINNIYYEKDFHALKREIDKSFFE